MSGMEAWETRHALLGIEEEIKGCKLVVLKLGRKNPLKPVLCQ